MPDATEIAIALRIAKRDAFKRRLDGMTPADRRVMVEQARREDRWPDDAWLRRHARKMLPPRTPGQYVTWGQLVKRRPRTHVYAFIHLAGPGGTGDGHEGLAFIDPTERTLVWFDLETDRNVSIFDLDEPEADFITRKGNMYWRLEDTELSPPATSR